LGRGSESSRQPERGQYQREDGATHHHEDTFFVIREKSLLVKEKWAYWLTVIDRFDIVSASLVGQVSTPFLFSGAFFTPAGSSSDSSWRYWSATEEASALA
jgi:hypothetical protein